MQLHGELRSTSTVPPGSLPEIAGLNDVRLGARQVAEVHSRALEAEPVATTLLDHLIDKHGHHDEDNITMRDRGKRLMVSRLAH